MRSENAVTQQSTTDPCTDWRPLATCCLGTFLLLAYTTVVTVSAPVIAESVGSGFAVSQWIIDVYTLALAALVLAMGSLSDRIGHRQLFLIGLAGLGTASVACAAATTGGMLIAARGAQGIGGAAVFATVVPLLTQCYDGRARGIAFAVWGAVAGAGSTVGTVAGGAVTEFVTWRWLFVAAVPICAVAVTIGAISLPRERPARTRVDVAGTALLTTAMTGTTFAVINGGEHGWTTAGTLGGIAVAAASLLFLIPAQRRAAQPVLPATLFATRGFVAVLLVGFAYYFAAFAALPVLSRWLQDSQHMGPFQAALILSIQLVAFIVISLGLSAQLHDASRARVLGGGTVLTGLACLSGVALLHWPHWTALIVALILSGVGAGVVSPVLPAVAATSVPAERVGTAAAAANSARQLGLTIGIAVCGALSQSTRPTYGLVAALVVSGLVALCGGGTAAALLRRTDATPKASH